MSSAAILPEAPGERLEPASRRERRKAETRRRLLDAARNLFSQRGYDATRPQDIARRAAVAIGTFYLHFEDKRDAFLAFSNDAARELMESVRARTEGSIDFAGGLRAALEAILDYAEGHPGVLAAAFADQSVIAANLPSGASLRERLALVLAEALRGGMARGELRADYDAAVVANGIVGLMQQGIRHGVQGGAERNVLLDNLVRFCARALVTPPRDTSEESSR